MLRDQIHTHGLATPRSQINPRINQNPEDIKNKTEQNQRKIPILYKIVVAIFFVVGYTIYRIFYDKFDNNACIVDTYFNATWAVNRWLRNHAGNVIIGIGQVIMDAWILFAGTAWFILQKNMRFPLAAGMIFLFRAFFLNIEKIPFDDYIVWHSPGFLSFTVPYDRTRDFFFSGHTASLSIVMLQMFYLRWYWVGAFAFVNLVYMMNMLIITRVHYTMDVMAGLIFAITAFRLTILIIKYLDFLLSIPFYIGRKIYYKIKKSNIEKQYEKISPPETEHRIKNHVQPPL